MTARALVLITAAAGMVSATATLHSAQAVTTAPTPAAATAKRVESGEALYKKKGCYECHVQEAQGGPQGPRLGPNPIPLPRFTAYVRNPTGEMPPFTERVLTSRELEDIYAFLQARPQPKPVASLPQLAP
jgi:ubiquinol-cytochrome c reductase cytochrome c subunit